jgi:acetylornithine/succinyldiaminopimelate/putrescine aminotransferase
MPAGFDAVPYDDVPALEAALAVGDVAAVLLEGIQAEGGINVPTPGYLRSVAACAADAGALVIMDEVQTGLGRTGTWFSFQDDGISPDIVTMAKSLGNGVPVGACWARTDIAEAFVPGDHGSTYGGQPLAMAAALATLSTLIDIDAPRTAARMGRELADGLADLPGVVAVRGRGLLLGAVLAAPVAPDVVAAALQAGLVVNAVASDVVRLAPPFTVSDDEVHEALEILGGVLRHQFDGGAY